MTKIMKTWRTSERVFEEDNGKWWDHHTYHAALFTSTREIAERKMYGTEDCEGYEPMKEINPLELGKRLAKYDENTFDKQKEELNARLAEIKREMTRLR